MEGLEWDTPSGPASMALGNGHQAIQDMALGVTAWDKEEKRAKLINKKRKRKNENSSDDF